MKYLSTILAFFFSVTVISQPLSWFNQYQEVIGLFNPAAINRHFIETDQNYNWISGVTARNEGGLNFSDHAPLSVNARLEYLKLKEGYYSDIRFFPSMGVYFFSDDFGPTSYNTVHFRIGFYAPLNSLQDGFLSGGIIGGFGRFGIDWQDDFFLVETGDVLEGTSYGQNFWNLGGGIFYKQRISRYQRLYVGLSALGLTDLDLVEPNANGKFGQEFNLHWHGILGGYFYMDDESYLEPAMWIRSDSYFSLDTYFSLRYNQVFRSNGNTSAFWIKIGSGGFFAPNTLRAGLEVGFKFENHSDWPSFTVGLGYDLSFSKLPSIYDNSLELNMSFFFP